jgi:hypothetical protein
VCAFFRTDVLKENSSTERPQVVIPQSLYFPVNNILGIINQSQFISSIDVPLLLRFLNRKGRMSKDIIKKDYPNLYTLIPSLKESDNQMLVLFKFR